MRRPVSRDRLRSPDRLGRSPVSGPAMASRRPSGLREGVASRGHPPRERRAYRHARWERAGRFNANLRTSAGRAQLSTRGADRCIGRAHWATGPTASAQMPRVPSASAACGSRRTDAPARCARSACSRGSLRRCVNGRRRHRLPLNEINRRAHRLAAGRTRRHGSGYAASRGRVKVVYEHLESHVRGQIQDWIQDLLEEEVDDLLGRQKHERRAAVDAPSGYRNRHGKPRRLNPSSGKITVRRPRVRDLDERFESRILPLFLRRTREVDDLLPEL